MYWARKYNQIIKIFILIKFKGSGAFCKNLQAVYTEADGCRIVTDLALSAFENQLLMLSAENETWTPSSSQYANQSSALEGSGKLNLRKR